MDHMLDLDQFGEVMDNLLRDNEIQMLITNLPQQRNRQSPDDGGGAVEND